MRRPLAENGDTSFWAPVHENKAAWASILQSAPLAKTCILAIVIGTRNDAWGGSEAPLHQRAARALSVGLQAADEIELVDMNSPGKPMVSLLPASVSHHRRLRSIVVSASQCAAMRGGRSCGSGFHEVLARNVGVLAALSAGCEAVASSNIDVIPPARHVLDELLHALPSWQHAYTLRRREVKMSDTLAVVTPKTLVEPWNATVHIHGTMRLGMDLTNQRAAPPSIITNCGDFQLARRGLFRRVAFAWALDGKRQYADTFIQASWLNRGVAIHVPDGIYVHHITHARSAVPGLSTTARNPDPIYKVVGAGKARRIANVARNGIRIP